MREERKTKKQLLEELAEMRQRLNVWEAAALPRPEPEEALRRQTAVLEGINQVFQEALVCESEEEVAQTCLAVAQQLTGSQFGFIGETNPAGRYDTIALSNPGWDACQMPDSEAALLIRDMEIRGIWGRVLLDQRSLIVNDPASHPDRVGTPPGHPPLTSFLGVPLKQRGQTIGMIALANKAGGYDLADQEDIERLSVAFVEALMRQRAEAALRQSEEHYRILFDEMLDGFALHEILCDERGQPDDYRFLEVNPAFEAMTGLQRERVVGKTVREVLPGIEAHWIETYGKVALSGEPTHFESYAQELDKHFEVMAFSPTRGQFATIFTDVTERKQAEEKIRAYQERLEEMVEERTAELKRANEQLQQEFAERRRAEETIQRQAEEILEVSTPVVQVWDGVVVVPLIGTLDRTRTQQFMERLLQGIVETNSSIALIDITGVPLIDTFSAQYLIKMINAVRLMGAQVLLTGLRPPIAMSLVDLGIDLAGVRTTASLADGLRLALGMLNLQTVRRQGPGF